MSFCIAGGIRVSEMISLIHSHSTFDGRSATRRDKPDRVRYIEFGATQSGIPDIDLLAADDNPRLMRTHLPAKIFKKQLAEEKVKFVVVMRNVKDNLVSFYHFYRSSASMGHFPGPWNDFFKLFQAKGLFCGDWLEFNLSWWAHRRQQNIMIINYEDIIKGPHKSIQTIALFLNKPLTDAQLDAILQRSSSKDSAADMTHSSHIKMREEIGDWQAYFTPQQNDIVDKLYVERAKIQGMTFEFRL